MFPEANRISRGKHRQSRVHKTYCFPEVSVNKYFIIYQKSKKRKGNFIRKYINYFINFLKSVKFNSVHTVIHKTFAGFGEGFGCPKVACSRDCARGFFCYSPVNNALSPSRTDARETV